MQMQAKTAQELNELIGGNSGHPDINALLKRFRHYAQHDITFRTILDIQKVRGWSDTAMLAWLVYNLAASKEELREELLLRIKRCTCASGKEIPHWETTTTYEPGQQVMYKDEVCVIGSGSVGVSPIPATKGKEPIPSPLNQNENNENMPSKT